MILLIDKFKRNIYIYIYIYSINNYEKEFGDYF